MDDQQQEHRFDVYPSYKGGSTTIYGGYVWEFYPSSPLCNLWGFVPQHRLIGEDMIGRPLIQHSDPKIRECVHHRNEIRTDNRLENLVVMTFSEHRRHHALEMNKRREERLSAKMVSEALDQTGSIQGVAKLFGVHHQTLRNRFPELVKPYLRATPTDWEKTDYQWQLLEVARFFAGTEISFDDLAKLTHMCAKSWAALCQKHKIDWKKRPTGAPGKKRMTYRGQPTRYALELYDQQTAPV